MFWGLIMEAGKRYAQTVDKSFHVSMACLEPNSNDNEYVPLMLDIENQEYVLCNLHKHKTIQCQLDLNFRSGNKIAFFTSGKSRVHLTGYLIEDEDDDNLEMSGDMSDLEEEEEEEISPVKLGKKIANAVQNKRKSDGQISKLDTKKAKINQIKQEDSDEDDDDDDEDDDDIYAESDESEDELSAGDSDEEDEDESDDMAVTQVQKTPESKKDKMKKMSLDKTNKTPVQLNKTKTPVQNQEQKKKKKSLNQTAIEVTTPKTPAHANEANGTHPTPHPSKKKNKKGGESPAVESPKSGPQTPGTPGGGLLKKTLQGGVFVQDLKLGEGQVAKAGKRVTVYYTGRLKQNNKQFDAATQGPGFKFQLGAGEVIKGWDIGVTGMRVGGKRKIVCPPQAAYGNKGSPPAIPPNSALVFEVELRSVN